MYILSHYTYLQKNELSCVIECVTKSLPLSCVISCFGVIKIVETYPASTSTPSLRKSAGASGS